MDVHRTGVMDTVDDMDTVPTVRVVACQPFSALNCGACLTELSVLPSPGSARVLSSLVRGCRIGQSVV